MTSQAPRRPSRHGATLHRPPPPSTWTRPPLASATQLYFFGVIDVLEKFSLRWRVQRVVLRLLYCLAMRWNDSDGISAMPPPLYADRFQTFVAHEVD